MSRPRTLAVTTTRRLPFSRRIWFGPSVDREAARPAAASTEAARPFGAGRQRHRAGSPAPRRSSRTLSVRRTTIGKRRSPSNTMPASRPPMAAPITSCIAAMLRPSRAISALSILISRTGRPGACSTFTSSAPAIAAQDRGDLVGGLQHRLELVAEHLHGDVAADAGEQLVEAHLDRLGELVVVAGERRRRPSRSARCSSALDRSGSGHSACGFRMMKVSDEFGGIGSEATSAVPVFEKTKATCGNWLIACSTFELHRLRLGQARSTGCAGRSCAMFFSSSVRDELLAEPGEQEAGARRAAPAAPRRTVTGARMARARATGRRAP